MEIPFQASDLQLCKELCYGNPECLWYTYDGYEGFCVFFPSCSEVDTTKVTMKYGMRECVINEGGEK